MSAKPDLRRRLVAEGLGTTLLVAIVVGSGMMADALTADDAVSLLGNTIATGAGLAVLILIFSPISSAHFNPAVTLAFWMQGEVSGRIAWAYVAAQLVGALVGVALTHAMFELPIMQTSIKQRSGLGQAFGEAMATFALVLTILATVANRPIAVPYAVGLVVTAGYWFTSSTSFANPAVTVARSLTDTFAGIQPTSVPAFVVTQCAAAVLASLTWGWLWRGSAATIDEEQRRMDARASAS